VNRAVAWCIGACALLYALSARAQAPRTARLEYTRGAGALHCPDEAALRGAVASRLGYDPFRADAPRTITAAIARAGAALRAVVKLSDASGKVTGTRQLSSEQNDCSELLGAVTLAISLAIDPQSQLRAPAIEPQPPVPTPPADPSPFSEQKSSPAPEPLSLPSAAGSPAPSEARSTRSANERNTKPPPEPPRDLLSAPRAPAQPAAPPRRFQAYAGLGGVAAAGTTPGITLGLSAQLGLRRGVISTGIEGRADLPTSEEAPGGGVVRASLLLATIAPCYHADPILACALLSLGVLRGSGAAIERPREDATLFGAAGARLAVEILSVGPFSARLHGDLAVTLTPTHLRLNDQDVWRTAPVGCALGIAGLVRFLEF
jgi:hypothetical protein